MHLKDKKDYEAPRAEIIEVESQGVLCTSDSDITGLGLQFETTAGSWGSGSSGSGFQFGTSDGSW